MRCVVEDDRRRTPSRLAAPLAARRAAARRARIRHRRPDQPVQGGHRPRLQGVRDPPAGGHPPPLRPAVAAAARRRQRRSSAPISIAAYFEATRLAGFAPREGERYFGGRTTSRPLYRRRSTTWPDCRRRCKAPFLAQFPGLIGSMTVAGPRSKGRQEHDRSHLSNAGDDQRLHGSAHRRAPTKM